MLASGRSLNRNHISILLQPRIRNFDREYDNWDDALLLHALLRFKWGDYKLTMGIRFIDETEWFTLYKSYPSYIRLRELRHKVMGKECVATVAHPTHRNKLAALEASRSIAAYLGAKYPDLFQVELAAGAESPGHFGEDIRAVHRIESRHLDLPAKRWSLADLDEKGNSNDGSETDPMLVAGELVPDDLAILLPDDDSLPDDRGALEYRLIAGSICTAGFWRLSDKINCTLQQIHTDGKVPQYEERLRDPLDRFFTKMERGGPRLAERNNYFFQVVRRDDSIRKVHELRDGSLIPDEFGPEAYERLRKQGRIYEKQDQCVTLDDKTELTWGLSTNGPEHLYDATLKGPQADVPASFIDSDLEKPIECAEDLVMRTERQTLRKLPVSGAVIFTIHTHMVPVSLMVGEPGVPGRLAHAIRHWPDKVSWYKGASLYRDSVLPYLDIKHQEQVEAGLVGSQSEEEEKSRKSYPL